jgi:hypothetical protein
MWDYDILAGQTFPPYVEVGLLKKRGNYEEAAVFIGALMAIASVVPTK